MSKPEEIFDPNPTGPDTNQPSRSSFDEVTVTDQAPSDLNCLSEELSGHIRNVDLNELSVPISVSKGIEKTDSKALGSDQKEDEEEEEVVEGRDESERESTMEKRMIVFPVRPDAEDCSFYMRTESCKYGSSWKFNHPPRRKLQDQSMCTHYSRYGICKFDPACRFDHSIPPTFSPSSSQNVEAPQVGANGK